MSKFKAGDVVRIVRDRPHSAPLKTGETQTLSKSVRYREGTWETTDGWHLHAGEDFELAEAEAARPPLKAPMPPWSADLQAQPLLWPERWPNGERLPPSAAALGVKHDGSKARFDLIPVSFLNSVAGVLTFGAEKYDDRNWEKGFRYGRVYAAALRHLTAWWNGQDNDPETGMSHLAHAATNMAFLVEFETRKTAGATDDRPHKEAA